MPEWSPFFPPFNLARLSAVAKHEGYQTKIMDVNVRAYNLYLKEWRKKLPFPLWNPTSTWRWLGEESYLKNIHPIMEGLFNQAIEEIVSYEPDLIGFTEYYINQEPTNWVAQQIKKRLPNVKMALGGSNVHNGSHVDRPYYDYIVTGEGEEVIVKILNDIESGKAHDGVVRIKQDEDQRMDLNDFPVPDYSGIDFNQYQIPNGVNSEFSRGCIAKCTFCEETRFYKYRQRTHMDVIREIEYLNKEKGTDVIWFVDSLVNGNLKELRAF
jgi:anaerobic magnesium-protoporphyrin IX monomethyl ester cyclase